jgi:hypothetical protein
MKTLLAGFLFALCGGLSGWMFDAISHDPAARGFIFLLPGVPFAILAAALCWRSLRGLVAAPLVVLCWYAAYWCGLYAQVLAPLVGGFGLLLCDRFVCRRRRPGQWELLRLSVVSVLAFVPVLNPNPVSQFPHIVILGFIVWQCAVGTCLYATSTGSY